MNTKRMARGAAITALYVVITYFLAPISFGPLQFRAAEALTLLPIIFPEAVPALFLGVLLANVIGGLGMVDIIGGSLVTLLAAYVTYKYRDSIIAYLSPIVFNAFLISIYLHLLFSLPYWLTVLQIGISQALVILLLGYPMIKYLKKYYD
ncbi:QueT transporter family protein [Halanaerobium sp. Z-7514]|uniref:QueT transporter family protein n=1 Tax=Halanaerobium polyolivorans TaxID=2886943 RepID=A0AAW4WXT8_9FIRM|nr:QueT transporter family protein [Halanaerobium polyolivorans]RQD74871.1 MAG: QueT transporter family protein [Halanaerobium sp. MSAO_Bac5]